MQYKKILKLSILLIALIGASHIIAMMKAVRSGSSSLMRSFSRRDHRENSLPTPIRFDPYKLLSELPDGTMVELSEKSSPYEILNVPAMSTSQQLDDAFLKRIFQFSYLMENPNQEPHYQTIKGILTDARVLIRESKWKMPILNKEAEADHLISTSRSKYANSTWQPARASSDPTWQTGTISND